MRELNSEQIDILFKLCEDYHIYHYDIQVELVDHLASSIENLWKNDPTMDFKTALIRVYEKFGASGFKNYISTKEKTTIKKFSKQRRILFFQNFTPPRIFIVLLIGVILSWPFLQHNLQLIYIETIVGSSITVCLTTIIAIMMFIQKKRVKRSLFLFESGVIVDISWFLILNSTSIVPAIIQEFSKKNIIVYPYANNRIILVYLSYFVCLYTLACWKQFRYITQYAKKNYPKAFENNYKMTLTTEQINTLFQLCEQQDIQYYDVQVEIVDHLASTIEAEIMQDPNLTFEIVLKQLSHELTDPYLKKNIKQQIQLAESTIQKNKEKIELSFIQFPRVIITISILFILFTTSYILKKEDYLYPIKILTFSVMLIDIARRVYLMFEKRKFKKELLSLKKYNAEFCISYVILNTLYILLSHSNTNVSFPILILFVLVLTYYIVFMHSSLILWDDIKKYSQKNYPQAFEKTAQL